MDVKIINLTPHDVNLYNQSGTELLKTFPKSGSIARIKESGERVKAYIGGDIPVIEITYDEPVLMVAGSEIPMPPFERGTYYIVSRMLKDVLFDRADFIVPSSVVRDSEGKIIGCKGFSF